MKTVSIRTRLACMAGTLAATAALAAPLAAQAEITSSTSGPFTYVCGGIAADEQQELRSEASHYDMGLLFTQGARGEYLADVNVKLLRNGRQLAEFNATGPRCLIRGPRGAYQVIATYDGTSKRTTLSPGEKNVQLRW